MQQHRMDNLAASPYNSPPRNIPFFSIAGLTGKLGCQFQQTTVEKRIPLPANFFSEHGQSISRHGVLLPIRQQ